MSLLVFGFSFFILYFSFFGFCFSFFFSISLLHFSFLVFCLCSFIVFYFFTFVFNFLFLIFHFPFFCFQYFFFVFIFRFSFFSFYIRRTKRIKNLNILLEILNIFLEILERNFKYVLEFLIFWRNMFKSKNQILASETSKIHNSKKLNQLRTKSPLSKVMTILLFFVNLSLR